MSNHRKLKRFAAILLAAVFALTLTACAAKSAFDFDKDAAVRRAEEVIGIVNKKDYTGIYNAFSDNAKKLTTVDGIKAAFEPTFEALGAFVEIKSTDAVGLIAKDGTKYITVYVKTKYEKGTVVHTISFDTDLNLEGFYTK